MTERVYNFGAGPAMLPIPVMEKFQREFLDFQGMGVSVIEISHRSSEFKAVVDETIQLFRKLTQLPDNYEVIFVHGGAQMQFSAIPLNLIGRVPSKKALFVETGVFSKRAIVEAQKHGTVKVIASSAETNYDHIPTIESQMIDQEAAYLQITGNNTIVGTTWPEFPETGEVPLVVDATSDILSKTMNYSKVGVLFASLQKNLGPSGVALVVIRRDLLGYAQPHTPNVLDYALGAKDNSLTNTANTFAIYLTKLVLEWLDEQGGVAEIEKANRKKADLLYEFLDSSGFYSTKAMKEHRSMMNVPFQFPSTELETLFLKESRANGLYALKGHRIVGGARASIYNPMPLEGVEKLIAFMSDFEQKHG